MTPVIAVCLQLLVTVSVRCYVPYSDRSPLDALFSSAPKAGGNRELPNAPVLIESHGHGQPQFRFQPDEEEVVQRPLPGEDRHHHSRHPVWQDGPRHHHSLPMAADTELEGNFNEEDFSPPEAAGPVPTENQFDNEVGENPPFSDRDGADGNEPAGRNVESIDLIREQLERIKQEEDIEIKSNLLMKLLTEMPDGPLPVLYIEDAAGQGSAGPDDGTVVTGDFTPNASKRSGRYYRRYPWKRQNARARTYDAEARYLCVPSREDVFKLLVGIHENRIGNQQRTINFCNRKRPARAIFTNIRFLG